MSIHEGQRTRIVVIRGWEIKNNDVVWMMRVPFHADQEITIIDGILPDIHEQKS